MVTRIIFNKIQGSSFIDLYLLSGFTLSLIFFILNYQDYKPIEVFFGIIILTVIIKSLINIMLGLLIKFQNVEELKEDTKYQDEVKNIELLLQDYNLQTITKATKTTELTESKEETVKTKKDNKVEK